MKKILIVDDNEEIGHIVKHILHKHKYEVNCHLTGANVSEFIALLKPALILLDVGLPGKTGFEICKEVKLLYHLPVILISAYLIPEDVYAGCMADGCIQKPFHLNELLTTIKANLKEVAYSKTY